MVMSRCGLPWMVHSELGSWVRLLPALQGFTPFTATTAGAEAVHCMRSAPETPWFHFCEAHVQVVELLLGKGADPDLARTDDGRTPLYAAAYTGHVKVRPAVD